uniref:WW domain-containing protein n=1 Tax=Ditylenchus dipsaci TaxID=166011 RepID=A0A915ES03_9BILA
MVKILELLSYAQSIGIDTQNEKHLLWIAEKDVTSHCQMDGVLCRLFLHPYSFHKTYYLCFRGTDDDKDAYFYEEATGKTQWEHPLDAHFKQLVIQERRKLGNLNIFHYGDQPNESMLSPIPENSTSSRSQDGTLKELTQPESPPSFSPDSRSSPFHTIANAFEEKHVERSPEENLELHDKSLLKARESAPTDDLKDKLVTNTMARLSIQIDEIIRKNWMEYCCKSTESYATLLEQCHLF